MIKQHKSGYVQENSFHCRLDGHQIARIGDGERSAARNSPSSTSAAAGVELNVARRSNRSRDDMTLIGVDDADDVDESPRASSVDVGGALAAVETFDGLINAIFDQSDRVSGENKHEKDDCLQKAFRSQNKTAPQHLACFQSKRVHAAQNSSSRRRRHAPADDALEFDEASDQRRSPQPKESKSSEASRLNARKYQHARARLQHVGLPPQPPPLSSNWCARRAHNETCCSSASYTPLKTTPSPPRCAARRSCEYVDEPAIHEKAPPPRQQFAAAAVSCKLQAASRKRENILRALVGL